MTLKTLVKIGVEGSGVYAIYYHGSHEAYLPIAESLQNRPVYVGKAVPTGSRKGGKGLSGSQELQRRLKDHCKSLEQADHLNIQDFGCRYLAIVPIWITLAERFLIEHYRPIWNVCVDGFGDHDPGAGRLGMRRPRWDILHSGRQWAKRLKAEETVEEIIEAIKDLR
ncbi:MAG: Eco29kI family restriction endonuclease [Candidatus Coatesbacteria bacterium]|nr:Eco29kI family restriction endonuclease [Candidatus Coatesbacteria bacterium]